MAFETRHDRIEAIRLVLNPAKLAGLQKVASSG
jgi:hypothetical protein